MRQIIRHLPCSAGQILLLWSGLSMPVWAASAPVALPTPDQFFRSSLDSEGAERTCNPADVRLEPANLKEVNADAQKALDWLKGWGAQHFRFKGPAGCTDWEFVLTRWQITIGLPVTGVMSAAEVKSLLVERDRTALEYKAALREAKVGDAELPELNGKAVAAKPKILREPKLLELLPTAPNIPFDACVYGLQEGRNWARQQELMQRRRLRSDLWQTGLPPHWASFISSNHSELGMWMQAHDSAKCTARAALRHWLKTIGDRSDIEDPRSTAQTSEIFRAAEIKFAGLMADYQKQKEDDRQAFEANATSKGALEDHLVRHVDLSEISVGVRRSDLALRLPQKICQDEGNVTRCQPNVIPCGEPKEALDRAQQGFPPNKERIESAKENLNRCEFAYEKSAAGRSSVVFAGQQIGTAQLRFENGLLVEMDVDNFEDPEAVRRMLTRRYGAAQTSHEKRLIPMSKYSYEPTTDPMGRTTWVHRNEIVDVEDTVFHHTWTGKGFVIELTRSRFTMLKSNGR